MSKTVLQIRSNGQITLSAAIRRQAHLKEGDLLEVIVEEDGSLRLVPKVAVDRSQAYFWTRRWQEGEKEAEADIRAGRLHRFDDIEEALEFLDEGAPE
ncbi:MAG TPA: AbrB/MazE/SpoVT family DNA-binding domain-containing protein [Chloroflexi bacterium]|nr:AbrB/MazE/SpoVT family DNA-binding domain-containing protein [Chloroflexota bacterium]